MDVCFSVRGSQLEGCTSFSSSLTLTPVNHSPAYGTCNYLSGSETHLVMNCTVFHFKKSKLSCMCALLSRMKFRMFQVRSESCGEVCKISFSFFLFFLPVYDKISFVFACTNADLCIFSAIQTVFTCRNRRPLCLPFLYFIPSF